MARFDVASSPLRKYLLLQIPGATLAMLVAAGAYAFEFISLTTAFVGVGLWIAKDAVLYPFLRSAYGPGPNHGTDALVGTAGVVTQTIDPEGRVRIGAELWSARSDGASSASIDAGSQVVVKAVDGFTLLVVPYD